MMEEAYFQSDYLMKEIADMFLTLCSFVLAMLFFTYFSNISNVVEKYSYSIFITSYIDFF